MTPCAAKSTPAAPTRICDPRVTAGTFLRKPGGEHGLSADVAGLLRYLDDATGDHIFDERRIDAGAAQQFASRHGHRGRRDAAPSSAPPARPRPNGDRTRSTMTALRMDALPIVSGFGASRRDSLRRTNLHHRRFGEAHQAFAPGRVRETTAADNPASPVRPRASSRGPAPAPAHARSIHRRRWCHNACAAPRWWAVRADCRRPAWRAGAAMILSSTFGSIGATVSP